MAKAQAGSFCPEWISSLAGVHCVGQVNWGKTLFAGSESTKEFGRVKSRRWSRQCAGLHPGVPNYQFVANQSKSTWPQWVDLGLCSSSLHWQLGGAEAGLKGILWLQVRGRAEGRDQLLTSESHREIIYEGCGRWGEGTKRNNCTVLGLCSVPSVRCPFPLHLVISTSLSRTQIRYCLSQIWEGSPVHFCSHRPSSATVFLVNIFVTVYFTAFPMKK